MRKKSFNSVMVFKLALFVTVFLFIDCVHSKFFSLGSRKGLKISCGDNEKDEAKFEPIMKRNMLRKTPECKLSNSKKNSVEFFLFIRYKIQIFLIYGHINSIFRIQFLVCGMREESQSRKRCLEREDVATYCQFQPEGQGYTYAGREICCKMIDNFYCLLTDKMIETF